MKVVPNSTAALDDERESADVLLRLISQERITEARDLLSRLDPHSSLRARFARVLGPPRVFTTQQATGQSLSQQATTLAGDLRAHRNKWAAIRDGQVIDSDADRKALRCRLRDSGRMPGSLFVRL